MVWKTSHLERGPLITSLSRTWFAAASLMSECRGERRLERGPFCVTSAVWDKELRDMRMAGISVRDIGQRSKLAMES